MLTLFGLLIAGLPCASAGSKIVWTPSTRPDVRNCTWKFFNQTLDHFSPGVVPGSNTFLQRYCFYDAFVPSGDAASPSTPIFFYTGNESPVEEYVNNTGLMWELGRKLGALLIFAEHRYEGESVPKLQGVPNCLAYCTSAQALADYATMIMALKRELGMTKSPVIAFGGSYGGMLTSWLRMKYPGAVQGGIAASAPIWGFPLDAPPLDGAAVAISRGLSAAGGATDTCRENMLSAWPLLERVADTASGREAISQAMNLCKPLGAGDARALLRYLQAPWFNMAEGDYPFPSTYITFAVGPGLYPLPAWPMRKACEGLNADLGVKIQGDVADVKFSASVEGYTVDVDWDQATVRGGGAPSTAATEALRKLFSGVERAVSVWYNVTGTLKCHDIGQPAATSALSRRMLDGLSAPRGETSTENADPASGICTNADYKGSWGPLCCNEDLDQVNYILQGVGRDVYWPPNVASRNYSLESLIGPYGSVTGGCRSGYASQGLYGVPSTGDRWSRWLTAYYGDEESMQAHSNIVFSNGLLDPWSAAGVFPGGVPPSPGGPQVLNVTEDGSVIALVIDLGAHHLDLFFSDENDPPCATAARAVEEAHIRKWIEQYRAGRK